MNDMINLSNDIEYFTKMRDDALEHFNDLVKQYGLYDEEKLHKSLDVVLRRCKQLKLLEDIKIEYHITKNNELLQKLSELTDDEGQPYFHIEFLKNLYK